VQPRAVRDRPAASQYGVEYIRQTVKPGVVAHGNADRGVQTERPASPATRVGVPERPVAGAAELARLDASRRHPAGEAAARHGTPGRSDEDHDTTEPRA
jgi:hypothetical protein